MSDRKSQAATRLACSWLLSYPDPELLARLDEIAEVVATLPPASREPLSAFLSHLSDTPLLQLQQHFVSIFDMKRRACPYLTYWTEGDTRNRGQAILRFKQAYRDAGFEPPADELPDHLAVVLEFAALGDQVTGDALLAENSGPIRLMRDSLAKMETAYAHVLDAIVATLPKVTPAIRARMAELAASGPPTDHVGLEPFANPALLEIGVRR